MRTERDRARSLADVLVGPRCKGVGRSGPSIMSASKPTRTPGVQVPSLRFSFRDHLSFVERRNIVRAVTVSLRGTLLGRAQRGPFSYGANVAVLSRTMFRSKDRPLSLSRRLAPWVPPQASAAAAQCNQRWLKCMQSTCSAQCQASAVWWAATSRALAKNPLRWATDDGPLWKAECLLAGAGLRPRPLREVAYHDRHIHHLQSKKADRVTSRVHKSKECTLGNMYPAWHACAQASTRLASRYLRAHGHESFA